MSELLGHTLAEVKYCIQVSMKTILSFEVRCPDILVLWNGTRYLSRASFTHGEEILRLFCANHANIYFIYCYLGNFGSRARKTSDSTSSSSASNNYTDAESHAADYWMFSNRVS